MNAFSKLLLAACCVAALAPIGWHAISSIKTPSELALVPPTLIPHDPTSSNYEELFRRRPFFRYYLNSFTIAALSSVVSVAAASFAAYRLARMRGTLRSAVRTGLLAIAFFPPIVFLFPSI
jgi:ABC-type glycerol-3-phosphate transport system permease component